MFVRLLPFAVRRAVGRLRGASNAFCSHAGPRGQLWVVRPRCRTARAGTACAQWLSACYIMPCNALADARVVPLTLCCRNAGPRGQLWVVPADLGWNSRQCIGSWTW